MKIESYKVVVKHDNGKLTLRVTSLNGEAGAILQIMEAESCPRTAIVSLKKLPGKKRVLLAHR